MITTSGIPYLGRGNAKLPDSTLTFALPSGHTCPAALHCLAKADRVTGRLLDGSQQEFRCYEASIEARYVSVRSRRWRNFDLLRHRSAREMTELLLAGIAAARDHKTTHVRWFTGGDLYCEELRDAISSAADLTDDLIHYYYTKNLRLLVEDGKLLSMPLNLRVTASWGGRYDWMLQEGLFPRTARVVHTRGEARELSLPIDTTDRLAWQEEPLHFCHLTHGSQPAGSAASRALALRRRQGDFAGYGRRHVAA